jgi:hypothetical protein
VAVQSDLSQEDLDKISPSEPYEVNLLLERLSKTDVTERVILRLGRVLLFGLRVLKVLVSGLKAKDDS